MKLHLSFVKSAEAGESPPRFRPTALPPKSAATRTHPHPQPPAVADPIVVDEQGGRRRVGPGESPGGIYGRNLRADHFGLTREVYTSMAVKFDCAYAGADFVEVTPQEF